MTNIDAEHLDHYGTHEAVKDAFVQHANRVPFYGLCVLCIDHPSVQEILPRVERRHVTYGISRQAGLPRDEPALRGARDPLRRLPPERAARHVRRPHARRAQRPQRPRRHRRRRRARGAARRHARGDRELPRRPAPLHRPRAARDHAKGGKTGDVMIVDDYGHHPAEIEATLDAAQRGFDRRVVVAFQPHRYTRTQAPLRRVHPRVQQGRRGRRDRRLSRRRDADRGRDGRSAGRGDPRARPPRGVVTCATRSRSPRRSLDVVEPGDMVIALGRRRHQRQRARAPRASSRREAPPVTPGNRRVPGASRPEIAPADSPGPFVLAAPGAALPRRAVRGLCASLGALRTLAGVVLVAGTSVGVAWVARRHVMTSSRFAIAEIDVSGNDHRARRRHRRRERPARSGRTSSSPISTPRARGSLPIRGSPTPCLARRLPGTIVVHVTERKAGAPWSRWATSTSRRPTASRSRSSRPATPRIDLPLVTGLRARDR